MTLECRSHRPPFGVVDRLINKLIRLQDLRGVGALARFVLKFRGTDIPLEVLTRGDLIIQHGGIGIVIHPGVRVGANVMVMQGVTIGRADPWEDDTRGLEPTVRVEDHAVLGAGATVIFRSEAPLTIAEGSVVGANAVLIDSTGPWEIWAGNPARKIGTRDPASRVVLP